MRKSILILVCVLTFTNSITCQNLDGKYFENSDFLEFKNNSVNFKIGSNGGVIVDLHGTGNYNIINEFLLIKTSDYDRFNSYHEKTEKEKENDLTIVTVLNKNKKPLVGVPMKLLDEKGDFLFGILTDENGQATLKNNSNTSKVKVSYFGNNYTFDYAGDFDYKVILKDYITIENKLVAFKINKISTDTLNLTLLSTDFKVKGDIKKDLKELENHIYRERVLKKK